MKNVYSALIATTALGLSMSMAQAGDDNAAYLDQDGGNHSASISQSGDRNDAGDGVQNLLQGGMWNTLTIDQSGSDNDIGLGANADSATNGVSQWRGGSSTKQSNKMTITQTSGFNTVGSAVQTSSGQGFNTLTISQGGTGNNIVGSVYQRQSSSVTNIATITQDGNNNTLARVSQDARTGGSYAPNEITVVMTGDNNGGDVFSLTGPALASGAQSSTLIQGTDLGTKGNKIDITVGGTSNEFGISQYGSFNSAQSIMMSGTDNELGIYQNGTLNMVTLGSISGTDNQFGIRQNGSSNQASLTATGNENGGYYGFGANVAGTLASSMGMTAGLIDQNGGGNATTLTISGDGNVFATLQDNSAGGALGNTITGNQDNSLSGGPGNQVAVAQMGDGNNANFNQVGSGNVTMISQ